MNKEFCYKGNSSLSWQKIISVLVLGVAVGLFVCAFCGFWFWMVVVTLMLITPYTQIVFPAIEFQRNLFKLMFLVVLFSPPALFISFGLESLAHKIRFYKIRAVDSK